MSSVYFNENAINTQQDKLQVIYDFYSGDSLKHFKTQFVDENVPTDKITKWSKRYRSSNYMDYVVREYLDYVRVLRELNIDLTSDEYKELIPIFTKFFKRNNWRVFYKNMAKLRKLYGDVYIYWFFDEDNIMRLKILDSKSMEIKVNKDNDIFAYVYTTSQTFSEKNEDGGEYSDKEIEVKIEFDSNGVTIYHDGEQYDKYDNKMEVEGEIPIIHLQFSKDENSHYSEIPTEPLIDLCLDLDRVETNIATINNASGAPKLIVQDGKIDIKTSGVGATSTVLYVDTLPDRLAKGKQVKVQQLEITNGLDSSYRERDEKIDILFRKANLVPPQVYMQIASSDSGQVVAIIRKDLEEEIKDFYEEIIDKFYQVFKMLLDVNGKSSITQKLYDENGKGVTFKMPETVIAPTITEKLAITAQKMNLNIETLTDYLKKEGKTDEEIAKHLELLLTENESITPENNSAVTEVDSYINDEVKASTNIDNKAKQPNNYGKVKK